VCRANPNAVLELDASGAVIHMTPTGGETGVRNSRLLKRLLAWAERTGRCSTAPAASACLMARC
jgi:Uma2 family endonuclease